LVEEPFLDLCPKNGWLHEYMSYTSWNEAPAPFHFFVGCAVFGAAMERRVYFNRGYYNLFPNIQLLLVAPTGRCRKSTATNIGVKILQQIPGIKFNKTVDLSSNGVPQSQH